MIAKTVIKWRWICTNLFFHFFLFLLTDSITLSTPFLLFSFFILMISYILFLLAVCSQNYRIYYFIAGVCFIISGKYVLFSFFFGRALFTHHPNINDVLRIGDFSPLNRTILSSKLCEKLLSNLSCFMFWFKTHNLKELYNGWKCAEIQAQFYYGNWKVHPWIDPEYSNL
jgi:hypothetical protein